MSIKDETLMSDFSNLMKALVLIFIFGVVSQMSYIDAANTPHYVKQVCSGEWEDYRESKPDCRQ